MNIQQDCAVVTSPLADIDTLRRSIFQAMSSVKVPKWFIVRAFCGTENCVYPKHLQARNRTTPKYQAGEVHDLKYGHPFVKHRDDSRDDYTGELINED